MNHDKTPMNPSRKAMKRVPEPHMPVPHECPYCSHQVSIVHHDHIYGRAYGEWPWVYACDNCGARTGMHPFTNIPLGTLADNALREERKRSKPCFERIWKGGYMDRTEAYEWLAKKLGITKEECHFGLFDAEKCQLAWTVCAAYFLKINGPVR